MTTDSPALPATHVLWALISLAFGSFVISTSEFASMGLLPLFANGLDLGVPLATNAITAYAIGVMAGAPTITVAAARLNKRGLLIALLVLAVIANLLTAAANGLGLLLVARFLSGLPQGAYFGAASVVATTLVGPDRSGKAVAWVMGGITVATIIGAPVGTWLGQILGWRAAYTLMAILGVTSIAALLYCLPRSRAFAGGTVLGELSALKRGPVWGLLIFVCLVVASLFAVYTFVGPLVTETAGMAPVMTPVALALIGIGMALGNIVGGHLADRFRFSAMLVGFVGTLVVLAVMALTAAQPIALLCLFAAMGFIQMTAVPTIPVQLMKMAPEAPTLTGAMNMAAFNIANAIGAAAAGLAVHAGYDFPAAIWAGFAVTLIGVLFFLALLPWLNRSGA
ncbi:MFS transporter [Salinisphaera sp. Q1T1-3]|uniref:MFS transporter n=1 Tax=Salinisphaera sp. Q1T1-3 TaxID=2321229 RepID=UPI000E736B36|nr:MFS transporter [Salinisphaera sp. Q1T1-3]RJS94826.1 MFS transporter [Salinisphaera sp. Q1T1-3]